MSKYKFALPSQIKGIVEWQLQHYKEDCSQLEQAKQDLIPLATSNFSSLPAARTYGLNRSTEEAVLRITTNQFIRQTEQSCSAISRSLSRCEPTDLRLIELVYWKCSKTVEGAGMEVGLSKSEAYKRINMILGTIALESGYINIQSIGK